SHHKAVQVIGEARTGITLACPLRISFSSIKETFASPVLAVPMNGMYPRRRPIGDFHIWLVGTHGFTELTHNVLDGHCPEFPPRFIRGARNPFVLSIITEYVVRKLFYLLADIGLKRQTCRVRKIKTMIGKTTIIETEGVKVIARNNFRYIVF